MRPPNNGMSSPPSSPNNNDSKFSYRCVLCGPGGGRHDKEQELRDHFGSFHAISQGMDLLLEMSIDSRKEETHHIRPLENVKKSEIPSVVIEEDEEAVDCTATLGSPATSKQTDPTLFHSSLRDFLRGRCIFRCVVCTTQFDGHESILQHALNNHQITPPEYIKSHGQASWVKSETVSCKICDRQIYWDEDFLVRHMRTAHDNMDIADYFLNFEWDEAGGSHKSADTSEESVTRLENQSEDVGSQVCDEDEITVEEHDWSNTVSLGEVRQKQPSDDDDLADQESLKFLEHPTVKSEYNGCLYECTPCGRRLFTSKVSILIHFRDCHKLSQSEYVHHFGEFRVLENRKTCHICQQQDILQDGLVFQQHLNSSHGINILQYCQLLNRDNSYVNNALFKCQECDEHIGTSLKSFAAHLSSAHHGMTIKKYEKAKGSVYYARFSQTCEICWKTDIFPSFSDHITHEHGLSLRKYRFLYLATLVEPCAEIMREETSVAPGYGSWAEEIIRVNPGGVAQV